MIERLEKVATPLTAATVVVPLSVPPLGLLPMATVMLAVDRLLVPGRGRWYRSAARGCCRSCC